MKKEKLKISINPAFPFARQRYFRVLNAGARLSLRVFGKIILASLAVFFQKTLHRLNTPTFFASRMKIPVHTNRQKINN
jgi:hypothetical protein